MRENFAPGIARFDNVERALAARGFIPAFLLLAGFVQDRDIQFAVGINRAGVALLNAELEFPEDFPALQVCSEQRIGREGDHLLYSGQRGYDHTESLVIGDAQSCIRSLRNAEALQVRVDMLAAAVHEHDRLAAQPRRHDAR